MWLCVGLVVLWGVLVNLRSGKGGRSWWGVVMLREIALKESEGGVCVQGEPLQLSGGEFVVRVSMLRKTGCKGKLV